MSVQPTHTDPDRRRWRVPAPLISGRIGLQGLSILEEFPSELGTILWQSLRTVRRWASAPPSVRRKLFLPGAHRQRITDIEAVSPDPALQKPLTTIAELLKNSAKIEAAQIGAACARIAEWAQGQNAPATEFDFVQAAALASPADPRLALTVARTARDRAEYPVAEAWYQRTIALARRDRDWDTYGRAYIGLGKTASARGVYPAARKSFLKAFRVASRTRLHNLEGMALHDLLVVETECQQFDKALEYAAAALRAYGPGHELLPSLAHDVVYIWMQQGRFADALPVLKAAVPRMVREQQPAGYGNTARAAGAVGDDRSFRAAWRAVLATDDNHPDKADALLETARGAASLGQWANAERTATRALELARWRRRGKAVLDAEAVLDWTRNERAAGSARTVSATSRKPAGILAQELARSLEASIPVV
jgi:tetratricopeptide (TPR) repeat protein